MNPGAARTTQGGTADHTCCTRPLRSACRVAACLAFNHRLATRRLPAHGQVWTTKPKAAYMSMQAGCPNENVTTCSHPQTLVPLLHQDATAAYCIAVAWLINHSGDARGAVTAAEGWASQNANEEVQGWLREAAEPGDGPSCLHMIGFVRWGFVHSFRQVLHMLFAVLSLRCEGSRGCAAVSRPF